MGKGSGSTRASSSGNPKGLAFSTFSINGWNVSPTSNNIGGFAEARAKGEEAKELYDAIQTPVERAVESKVGDIRSGGGFSGSGADREYTLIFREGVTKAQIQNYLKEMKTGARLYAAYSDAYLNGTEKEFEKARDLYEKWIIR